MRVSAWTAATLVWIALAGAVCLPALSADVSADSSAEARSAKAEARSAKAEARSAKAEAQRAKVEAQAVSGDEPAAQDKGGKELHALRIGNAAATIRLDGRIEDEVWRGAQAVTDFQQE